MKANSNIVAASKAVQTAISAKPRKLYTKRQLGALLASKFKYSVVKAAWASLKARKVAVVVILKSKGSERGSHVLKPVKA